MTQNSTTNVDEGTLCVPERWRLRRSLVPKSRYVDETFLELELERLFPYVWLMACRSEEVEEAGAFVEFTVGSESVAVVRSAAGELKALSNSCRHRGTRLLLDRGRFPAIRCPFHAWCWDFDGSFKYRPDADYFDEQDPKLLALPEYPVGEWGGFVFVSFDQSPPPLLEFLAPLPDRLAGFRLEDMRYKWHKSFEVRANWKTAVDAFIEAYHVPGTHPQYLRGDFAPSTPGSVPEMELWPPSVNEDYGLHGRTRRPEPAPDEPQELTKRRNESTPRSLDLTRNNARYHLADLGALVTEWDVAAAEECAGLGIDEPELDQYQRFVELRRRAAKRDGVDLPDLTRKQVHDGAYDWHIFPNTILLVTGVVGSLLGYRVLPHESDPERCVFDVFGLQLVPSGTKPDVTHERFDTWQEAGLGEVLSQDFGNLARVTTGMRTSTFEFLDLNLRQEMSIHRYHGVIDRFLFPER